jgi:hypothetical protein
MGIYLSTPSTEVELEEGSGGGVRFVVGEMQVRRCVEYFTFYKLVTATVWCRRHSNASTRYVYNLVILLLQGWRKNMEDAHIALTELSSETLTSAPKFSLFAVFDGHGGQ